MAVAHVSPAIIGAAGEYFAAAGLSARRWIATISVRGAPATDVLAQHVKTRSVDCRSDQDCWSRNDRFPASGLDKDRHRPGRASDPLHDEIPTQADNEWFVFVGLKEPGERLDYFVVSRNVVAVLINARTFTSLTRLRGAGA